MAELLVAYRFVETFRPVSWPLSTCPYDLLVDTGSYTLRVQVKHASAHIPVGKTAYQYRVRLTKVDSDPLPAGAIDLCCVVVDPERIYVIPAGALRHASEPARLVKKFAIHENGKRFAPFLNQFGLGTGELPEMAAIRPLKKPVPRQWQVRPVAGRKEYRRLTIADIDTIKQMNIAFYKGNPGLPIADIAHQFGVHVATLRNLLRGKRSDLR